VARDLVCFSHLRWDFVYQRPNHLMARAARRLRVYFIEEPIFESGGVPAMRTARREGVTVVTPVLPDGLEPDEVDRQLRALLDLFCAAEEIRRPVLWYYTPLALTWTRDLPAAAVVYDSMDYLAAFRGASPRLLELEDELLARADLVFAGGARLHGRMAGRHRSTHCFPSSIDLRHFGQAREGMPEPADLAPIGRPRIGFAGVIDERIDLELIDAVATARPDLEIVLIGPTAKIDEADVPAHANIHRLGLKPYAELPAYLGGWDVGWMPFARNEATRYISPTKTPEYLAAGLPVVSTSIHDVVEPYGSLGFVTIADTPDATIDAVDAALAGTRSDQARVDAFLASGSWDRTWASMAELIERAVARNEAGRLHRPEPVTTLERALRRRPAIVQRGVLPERPVLADRAVVADHGLHAERQIGTDRAGILADRATGAERSSLAERTTGVAARTVGPKRSPVERPVARTSARQTASGGRRAAAE
jgi:UDP-galactopyranose mutase